MKKEVTLIGIFYVLMGITHQIVLNIDIGKWLNPTGIVINYTLKALLTIPLLWLFFRKLPAISMWKKGGLHLLTITLFSFLWINIYYLLCDYMRLFRLRGQREIWDIYLTILFYGIQFGIFHVYTYSKELREQELLSAELSKLNAQSELSALKAQLNPHFLYNVFNTINAAIPTTAKDARNMVNELSDLFRYQLKASREELVSLKEELDFVCKYLDLEKQRFGNRLNYKIKVNKELFEISIPPIIIQPLVENSVKHGISPEIEGGEIIIEVKQLDGKLNLSICDTGKGINGKHKQELLNKGVGLSNTNKRLLKMYGTGLVIKANLKKGFCVNFTVPINKKI